MLETEAPSLKPRVLWIEDDLKYAKLLGLELGHQFDFDVHPLLSPELCARIQQGEAPYDGIMIDMHLVQGRQGPEAFRQLRELGYKGPIFVLSNDETVISKLEMLALGVDDYLWKVMPTEEMVLRLLNAIQRHQARPRSTELRSLEGLEIHTERLTASLHGRPLELSKIELRILLALFRTHPQALPVERLKTEGWEGSAVEDGTLSTFFWKLNKKTQGWKLRIVRAGDEVILRD